MLRIAAFVTSVVASVGTAFAAPPVNNAELREQAQQALKKAATCYRQHVASHGGYVYYYSEDLSRRWGEGKLDAETIEVQPPGTPSVGMAYLNAYRATRDSFYLDAAREAAEALVYGQLESGGWTHVIHFNGGKRAGKYRNGKGGSWNASSLDDGQTQSALQLLARTDEALGFEHKAIHDAALFGYAALLAAQFPNGAFPQVWTGPVASQPVMRAKLPDYDWRAEGRLKNYWDYYTLNDDLAGTVTESLIAAHQVYGDEKYRAALKKLGDFLILAQMPEPQPGWCQQYNYDMVPIWARKFEPPAISGWESQDAIETLIKIAQYTGDDKYLEPVPRGLDYFTKRCLLPDGRVARYYELVTNKPLYMDADYRLTYEDSQVPAHYGWKQPARFEQIKLALRHAKNHSAAPPATDLHALRREAQRILAELDSQDRWVSTFSGEPLVGQPKFPPGFRYISSATFTSNVETLSRFLTAAAR